MHVIRTQRLVVFKLHQEVLNLLFTQSGRDSAPPRNIVALLHALAAHLDVRWDARLCLETLVKRISRESCSHLCELSATTVVQVTVLPSDFTGIAPCSLSTFLQSPDTVVQVTILQPSPVTYSWQALHVIHKGKAQRYICLLCRQELQEQHHCFVYARGSEPPSCKSLKLQ